MRHSGNESPSLVLIVDDNVDLAENLAEILDLDGYVTHIAASAEEALTKALPAQPDVLVTDYRLPGINGANLVRQLRRRGLDLHAIVISAYTDQGTMDDARDAGALFVAKPVDFGLLGQVIRQREASA